VNGKTKDKAEPVVLNKHAVLDEIERVGRGFVKGITARF
jgi:hypothetical protein